MRISEKPLKEKGIRVTPQRAHVWRLLAESGTHMSAQEIWERTREVLPGMELSTVYRALEALREANLVVESHLPEGPALFEAHVSPHPHLVCERCGEVFHPEASPEIIRGLLAALAVGGFEVHELHVVARGLCPGCLGDEGGKRGGVRVEGERG
ncbi:transcriptional repressor [Rubrobacter xylanophilus]|uniref:Transcriptional repressor n=1 Tax=Rubrobacter xylanophilus TaxID=49319 RepID=A0A510HLX2_9ACTN|nr:transcriptional repressor [Rubrobacter xylanophilus]